ncbi:hypothetical protein [Ruegeria sp. SCP11]|uniref:hypothetical protein n=1 Tax=Ruegeria sp. SCP11 TaxID=3141378 RepID=UPI003339100D
MENRKRFSQLLKLAAKTYKELNTQDRTSALILTAKFLHAMLAERSTQRQRLAELETPAKNTQNQRSHAEKARGKLARKSSTKSPKLCPILAACCKRKNSACA